ncbi:hypothetical protein BD413DRAFT_182835 [Trametes elegans]|nr:hypothetical protein BD413DRAFT_182835 [Trametes elegans]
MALGLGCDMFLSNGDVSSFHFGTSPSLEFSQNLYLSSLDEKTYVTLDADIDTGDFLLSPQQPSTPSSPNSSSLSPVSPPFVMQTESLDRPSKASSTFLLDTHSLLPGHSLLSDTASFLALKEFGTPMASEPLQSPSPPPGPEPEPTPRGPRRSLESRSSATNRGVTVQRLALDLTLSPSGSLSALIHALEDAAPGWYQSLMESATPQELYESSWAILGSSPTLMAKSRGCIADEDPPCYGLSGDMLASLDALESVAVQVRQLPFPRPRTAIVDNDKAISLHPDPSAEASITKRGRSMLVSPPLTPPKQGREFPKHAPPRRHPEDNYFLFGEETPRAPSTPPKRPAYSSAPPSRIAVSNIANHPKLTRTLGLSSLTPSHLPTPRTMFLPRPEDLPCHPLPPLPRSSAKSRP